MLGSTALVIISRERAPKKALVKGVQTIDRIHVCQDVGVRGDGESILGVFI